MTIASLKDFDRKAKSSRADDIGIQLDCLYNDSAASLILTELKRLGVGLAGQVNPMHANLLKQIVDKLACVYSQPPTRWVRRNGKRLAESNEQHKLAMQVLSRAGIDRVWARADRMRSLHRQAFLRVYPQDSKGSVVVRLFEPFNVLRKFDLSAPDDLSQDEEIALCLCAGSDDQERWEHWTRAGDTWTMAIVNGKGDTIAAPYEDEVSPYKMLPITMVADEYLGGRAWLPPRASREAFQVNIDAMLADLHSLVVHQAHARQVWTLRDDHKAPTISGHADAVVLSENEKYEAITPNPKIAECQAVLGHFIQTWLASESLPSDMFQQAERVIATGAALRAKEAGLQARRRELTSFAAPDEQALWEAIVAVHNVHSGTTPRWDLSQIDPTVTLDVEVGEPNPVIDPQILQQISAADLALGVMSSIDYLQVRDGLTRDEAIDAYERIQEDRTAFPVQSIQAQDGPRAAGVGGTVEDKMAAGQHVGTAELMKSPSVTDAAAIS